MQYRGDNFLYGGIDFSVAGEGGPDCRDFITPHHRLAETAVFGLLSLVVLGQSWRTVRLERNNNQDTGGGGAGGGGEEYQYRPARQCLLVLLAVTFGLELGFKLSTGQVIWLLNPCHVLTVTQLFLLASPSTRLTNTVFRLHIYWLIGPFLAIAFPATLTRHIAGEVTTFWVQHLLVVLVPGYLLSTEHFTVERTSDTAWPCLAISVFTSYHWLVLQPIGLLTGVNLSNMLCPAASDQIHGTNYKIVFMFYFVFILPLIGKSYSLIAKFIIKTVTDRIGSIEEKLR